MRNTFDTSRKREPMVSLPDPLLPSLGVARQAYEVWCAGPDPDDAFAVEDDDELRAWQFVRSIQALREASKDSWVDAGELEAVIADAFPLAVDVGLLDPAAASRFAGLVNPKSEDPDADDSAGVAGVSKTASSDEHGEPPRSVGSQQELDDAYPLRAGDEYLIHRFSRPFGPNQLRVCERGVVWVRAADGQLSYDLLPYRSILAFEYQELRRGRVRNDYLNIRTVYGNIQVSGTTEELTAITELISSHMS
jgi:hypothetical protein